MPSVQVARTLAAVRRLPEPPSLGSPRLRRPLSLVAPERELRRALVRDFTRTGTRVLRSMGESGILGDLHRDASSRLTAAAEKRKRKAATGRGGRPLGPDRSRELTRLMRTEDMEALARLVADEERAFTLAISDTLAGTYDDLFAMGGRAARRALGVRGSFTLDSPAIADALLDRANQLAGNIAADVFERMKTVIADEFYIEGRSPLEVGQALAEEFDWLSSSRAELIARTETGAVTEAGQWMTYVVSGVPFKRWLTTLDGRERQDHFEAHGQIKAIDEPFIVGGEELMHPLDPAGSAAQVCNCRCTEIPVITADQAFSDADVWDGSNDPAEFLREREVDPDAPAALRPPPPDDFEDLDFAFPEDEKRAPAGWPYRPMVDVEEGERVLGKVGFRRALEWWTGKAERDYVRDDVGRFAETEGGGGDGESEQESGGAPASESSPPPRPRMADADYQRGVDQMKAAIAAGGGNTNDLTGALFSGVRPEGQAEVERMAAELGPAFWDRHYEENYEEFERVKERIQGDWMSTGGDAVRVRFASQDAFGFPEAPVWDAQKSGGAGFTSREESVGIYNAGHNAAYAGAMRVEYDEAQAALEPNAAFDVEGSTDIDDFLHDEQAVEIATAAIAEEEFEQLTTEAIVEYTADKPELVTAAKEWARNNLDAVERHAFESEGEGGKRPRFSDYEPEEEDRYERDLDEFLEKNNTAVGAWVETQPNEVYQHYVNNYVLEGDEVDEAYERWKDAAGVGGQTVRVDKDGRIELQRGVKADHDTYVAGPLESWTVKSDAASHFGPVMTQRIDRRRVLGFQGQSDLLASEFANEFEFLVLPDLPVWIRRPSDPNQLTLELKRLAKRVRRFFHA